MENINEIMMFVIKKVSFLLTLVFSYSTMADTTQPTFFPSDLTIRSGDLIFRQGTQPVSDIVLNIDNGGYSHVGMLYKDEEKNSWYVIHATPSELEGRADSVVLDELAFYVAKQNAKKYAIYQVKATTEQHKQAISYAYKQLGVPFDITAKQGTYCTLLVVSAWQAANIDFHVSFTHINMPLVAGNYLLPKELRASEKLKELYVKKVE